MKFTARVADLRSALEQASKIVPKNPSQVVYSGVRLRVRAGKLTVTGSDGGLTTITMTVPITEPTEGAKVLVPKPLIAYLATLPGATDVTVSAPSTLELAVSPAGAPPYTFRLMEVTFPNTTSPVEKTFDVNFEHLALAVRAVKHCVGDDRIAQVVSTPDAVLIHATDNHRVARATLPGVTFGNYTALLPIAVLEQLAEAPVTQVALDKRGRVFTASDATMTVIARQGEDLFHNVGSILDDVPPSSVRLPARKVSQALNRLASVAAYRRPVVVSIAGDQLTLAMDSVNIGSGTETVELEEPAQGEVIFAVNLEYLQSTLNAHPTDDLTLRWSGVQRPIFITSDDPIPVCTALAIVKV